MARQGVDGPMSTTKSEIKAHQQFIAGSRTGAADGRSFEDLDPFTGEVIATVPAASRADANRAVEAAAAAFPDWSKSPPAVRQRVFLRAADHASTRQNLGNLTVGGSRGSDLRLYVLNACAGRNASGSGVPTSFESTSTMSGLSGPRIARSSSCSALGTLNCFSVATRSLTSASNSPFVTFIPACASFMLRPPYRQGPPVASQT